MNFKILYCLIFTLSMSSSFADYLDFYLLNMSMKKEIPVSVNSVSLSPAQEIEGSKIIYGSEECGYFEAKKKMVVNDKLTIEIIPPCYEKEINFILVKNGKKKVLLQRKFKSPFEDLEEMIQFKVKGQPFHGFYVLHALFVDNVRKLAGRYKSRTKEYLSGKFFGHFIVINRFGQIVWVLKRKNSPFGGSDYGALKAFPKMGVLFKDDSMYDFKGNQIRPKVDTLPNARFREEIIGDYTYYFYKKYEHYKNEIFSSPKILEYAELHRYNRNTHKSNFVLTPKKAMGQLGISPNELSKKTIDWTHENRLSVDDNGYLLSYRNLNKLVYFNKAGEYIWSMGSDDLSTFQTSGKGIFKGQHGAILTQKNSVALIDNNKNTSRFLELSIEKQPEIICENILNEKIHSETHGHVFEVGKQEYVYLIRNDSSFPGKYFFVSLKDCHISGSISINHKIPLDIYKFKIVRPDFLKELSDPRVNL